MILRKVRGPQFHLPIGKIKLECLHEILLVVISNHPLAKDHWDKINTDDVVTVISFLNEFVEITCSPICAELGMYLESVIAILNRHDYRMILSQKVNSQSHGTNVRSNGYN